jgi:hypothetical protein
MFRLEFKALPKGARQGFHVYEKLIPDSLWLGQGGKKHPVYDTRYRFVWGLKCRKWMAVGELFEEIASARDLRGEEMDLAEGRGHICSSIPRVYVVVALPIYAQRLKRFPM